MFTKLRVRYIFGGGIFILLSLIVYGIIIYANYSVPEYRESLTNSIHSVHRHIDGPYDHFSIIAFVLFVIGCIKIAINMHFLKDSIKLSGFSEKELEKELISAQNFNGIFISKNNIYFLTNRFFETIPYSVITEIRLETHYQSEPITSEDLTELNSKTRVRFETANYKDHDIKNKFNSYSLIFVRSDDNHNDVIPSNPDKAEQLAIISAILDIKNDIPVTIA